MSWDQLLAKKLIDAVSRAWKGTRKFMEEAVERGVWFMLGNMVFAAIGVLIGSLIAAHLFR